MKARTSRRARIFLGDAWAVAGVIIMKGIDDGTVLADGVSGCRVFEAFDIGLRASGTEDEWGDRVGIGGCGLRYVRIPKPSRSQGTLSSGVRQPSISVMIQWVAMVAELLQAGVGLQWIGTSEENIPWRGQAQNRREKAGGSNAGQTGREDGAKGMHHTLRSSEKVNGEARSGSGSVSESVSNGCVMGFGHEKPGAATVLLRC